MGKAVSVTCIVWMCIGLGACFGPRNFENENDLLRRRNADMQDQVRQLQHRIDLQLEQIDELAAQRHRAPGVASGVTDAQPPILCALQFVRYTSSVDVDHDRRDDLVRIYLRTLDQDGRFLPVAAQQVKIQGVRLLPDHPPQVVAQRLYDSQAFHAAYRSGLTGTHYTLELELPRHVPQAIDQLQITVFLTDAASGADLKYTQTVNVRLPATTNE